MKIGEFVKPIPPQVLRTGSGYYTRAVVVSLEPFTLVSEDADMKWRSTIKPQGFEATGEFLSGAPLEQCLDRLHE